MIQITYEDYKSYLNGIEPLIPEGSFNFWVKKAVGYLLIQTNGRINEEYYVNLYEDCIKETILLLVDAIYSNHTPDGQRVSVVQSERVGEYNVVYDVSISSYEKLLDNLSSNLDYCNGKATNLRYRGGLCSPSRCNTKGCRI